MKLTHYKEKDAYRYKAKLQVEIEFTCEDKTHVAETIAEQHLKQAINDYSISEFITLECEDTVLVYVSGTEEIESED